MRSNSLLYTIERRLQSTTEFFFFVIFCLFMGKVMDADSGVITFNINKPKWTLTTFINKLGGYRRVRR